MGQAVGKKMDITLLFRHHYFFLIAIFCHFFFVRFAFLVLLLDISTVKKMNIHRELVGIISRLKPYEAETIENYLAAFARVKSRKDNKSLDTFKVLNENRQISYESLRSIISPELNKYSFNKFLARLRDKIFDALLLDLNISRKNSYSAWFRARQEATKNWVLIVNLLGRGNEASAIQLLNAHIKQCRQYELYDLLVSALRIKLNIDSLRKGPKAYKAIIKDIDKAEKCRDANNRAIEWQTQFYMVVDRQANQNEQVGILMEALSELQELFKETKTAEVGRFMYTFSMEYHQALGDYQAVKDSGNKLIDLIQNKPALKSPIRLSSAYANLAFNNILLHEFTDALHNISLSKEGAIEGSYNYAVITTLQAQAEYFNGDLDVSRKTIDGILSSASMNVAPFEKSKLQYLKACILFNKQQYFKAYNIFNSDYILMDSDPDGWNIGVRIMCILCLIEMQLNDLADLSIESFRKHISRTDSERKYKPRDKAILKILRSLERNSFDFALTYFKNQELFALLQSDEAEYAWKIKSHEHIVFQEWFSAKLAKKPYAFKLPELVKLEKVEAPQITRS